jgi:hypothetical protein
MLNRLTNKSDVDQGSLLQILRTLLTELLLQQKSPEDWLTYEEVAQEAKVSVDTIARLCAANKMRSAYIDTGCGSGRRFARRIQRRWLNEYMCRDIGLTDATNPQPACSRRRRRRPDVPDVFSD